MRDDVESLRPSEIRRASKSSIATRRVTRSRPTQFAIGLIIACAAAPGALAQSAGKAVILEEITVDGVKGERGTGPVSGYVARKSVTSTKTDTPLLETPQSISVVTKDEMFSRGAESLPQALQYLPSVSLGRYGSASLFDNPVVRGFTVPTYADGLRMPGDVNTQVVPFIDTYGLERLEVLRGSSSGLYGQSPPGGLINVISKRPTDTPHAEAVIRFGSFAQKEGLFDVGSPLDKQSVYSFRLVGLGQLSNAQTDFVVNNKYYIAPSFTFQPSPGTSLTILASSQRDGGRGYQQYVPPQGSVLFNPNGRIPYSRYLGEPGLDGRTVGYDAIGYALEHRFNESVSIRQNARLSQLHAGIGGYDSFGPLSADLRTVSRNGENLFQRSKQAAIDTQVQANLVTGPVLHKVLAGVDYYATSTFQNTSYQFGSSSLDMYNPVYGVPTSNAPPPFSKSLFKLYQTGTYLQDQARLGHVLLTLTGRFDNARSTADNQLALTSTARTDNARTGRAGLSYIFDNGLAPYVSYATNFEPTSGLDRLGSTYSPRSGTTKEIGVKYAPTFVKALFTAAYFDTDQNNVLTTDPVNPVFSVQTGRVNVKGVELEGKVSVTQRLDIVASYSHLNPRIASANDGTVGNIQPNIALDNAALWAMYTFREGPVGGLGLGGGVRYVGKSFADSANTFATPSYTLFDAAIAYDFAFLRPSLRGLTARVNVTNIANTYYVPNCFGTALCSLGLARTVLGTMAYRW